MARCYQRVRTLISEKSSQQGKSGAYLQMRVMLGLEQMETDLRGGDPIAAKSTSESNVRARAYIPTGIRDELERVPWQSWTSLSTCKRNASVTSMVANWEMRHAACSYACVMSKVEPACWSENKRFARLYILAVREWRASTSAFDETSAVGIIMTTT
eukprot:scaffold4321_cov33-Tisochrysis_lutea.AAC.7